MADKLREANQNYLTFPFWCPASGHTSNLGQIASKARKVFQNKSARRDHGWVSCVNFLCGNHSKVRTPHKKGLLAVGNKLRIKFEKEYD